MIKGLHFSERHNQPIERTAGRRSSAQTPSRSSGGTDLPHHRRNAGSSLLPELRREPADLEIVKKRYSAFFGTDLDQLLEARGVGTVVVAGVNTHACVRAAAVDAYQRDLEVVIPRECVASYDEEHHDVTLKYLARHIARVESLDHLLDEWCR